MTRADWLDVAALVADLWPNQEWSRETIASGYSLIADTPVSLKAASAVVRELSLAGREFAPPPGVVAAHLKAVAPNEANLLAEPDLTRDLTPEEIERVGRRAAELKARIAAMAEQKSMEPTPGAVRIRLPHTQLPKVKVT